MAYANYGPRCSAEKDEKINIFSGSVQRQGTTTIKVIQFDLISWLPEKLQNRQQGTQMGQHKHEREVCKSTSLWNAHMNGKGDEGSAPMDVNDMALSHHATSANMEPIHKGSHIRETRNRCQKGEKKRPSATQWSLAVWVWGNTLSQSSLFPLCPLPTQPFQGMW